MNSSQSSVPSSSNPTIHSQLSAATSESLAQDSFSDTEDEDITVSSADTNSVQLQMCEAHSQANSKSKGIFKHTIAKLLEAYSDIKKRKEMQKESLESTLTFSDPFAILCAMVESPADAEQRFSVHMPKLGRNLAIFVHHEK